MFSSPGCVSSKEAAPHGGCIEAKAAKWKDGTCFGVFVLTYFCGREWTAREDDRRRMDELTTKIYACWLQEGPLWFYPKKNGRKQ